MKYLHTYKDNLLYRMNSTGSSLWYLSSFIVLTHNEKLHWHCFLLGLKKLFLVFVHNNSRLSFTILHLKMSNATPINDNVINGQLK